MSTSPINDPEALAKSCEEARTLANQMSDETSKQTMLRIAADYDESGPTRPGRITTASKGLRRRAL